MDAFRDDVKAGLGAFCHGLACHLPVDPILSTPELETAAVPFALATLRSRAMYRASAGGRKVTPCVINVLTPMQYGIGSVKQSLD